jgi:hypothetical protein
MLSSLALFLFSLGAKGDWVLGFGFSDRGKRNCVVCVSGLFCMNFAESRVAKSSFLWSCFFVHEGFLDLFLRILRGGFRWHSLRS